MRLQLTDTEHLNNNKIRIEYFIDQREAQNHFSNSKLIFAYSVISLSNLITLKEEQ